ncbi:MAG: hypothetical protein KDH97_20105 [Calditrichaeota bacterium]|nr:hypothetical protein [Calditrichota bacterium]MCB9089189.1 hypothetical protein [Calditrichia bacterium]MCB0292569.1 hypothetical protein [Calditrichota bacterium]MCB0294578.1 hypothetical protein [Calditrichota bacterium]MCB0302376.1 hypothetical protein [Calditrichota bacterium]
MELLISLIGGAVGGNVAGSLLKNYNLGTLWNSVVGILGGGLGAQLLGMLGILGGGGGSAMDIGSIIANIASSGVGGGVLMVIVGLVKNMMGKK